jgi:VWFA-related protein
MLATLIASAVWTIEPLAQNPAASAAEPQSPVFRLSVSLAQVDAVVTDRQGHHVTTLGPADFAVYQDEKPQLVTAVSYIETEERWEDLSGLPPLTTTRVQDARRAVAIIFDDRRMSFHGVYYAKHAIQEFLDQELRSGDVAAMLLTTSGRGANTRRFTFDPAVLKSAVKRLRYSMSSLTGSSRDNFGTPVTNLDFDYHKLIESGIAVSVLQRISEAVDALKALPGRKSVILVSEGFSAYGGDLEDQPVREALQRLADRSNRAGVVVYAIDPRGVVVAGLTAADNPSADQRDAVAAVIRETQSDLRLVSAQTGGFAVVNNNDLVAGLSRIMADQRGYYLIGYQPEPGTVDEKGAAFRKVKITVKREGLMVRTRAGFYGLPTR